MALARARRRSRWPVLAAAAAVLALVVVLVVALSGRGSEDVARGPAASPPAVGGGVTPTPAPSATLLDGFTDCSSTVGRPAQCGPTPPQCWGGVPSNFDSLIVATRARCDRTHVYQTFAAGLLSKPALRQSELDADPAAKAVCTRGLVNAMLPADRRRDDWEVFVIPPQTDADNAAYFRCVFGRGERTEAFQLTPPG